MRLKAKALLSLPLVSSTKTALVAYWCPYVYLSVVTADPKDLGPPFPNFSFFAFSHGFLIGRKLQRWVQEAPRQKGLPPWGQHFLHRRNEGLQDGAWALPSPEQGSRVGSCSQSPWEAPSGLSAFTPQLSSKAWGSGSPFKSTKVSEVV